MSASAAPRTVTAHRWGPDADYTASWEIRAWDASEDRSLRRYWARGLSASVIAVKLGRSKNSVIGRARRLQLAPRPSPLGRTGQPDPYPDKAHTPPQQTPRPPKPWAPASPKSPPHPPAASPAPEQLPPARVEPRPVALSPVRTCQYPTSEDRPWRFCGDPTVDGGPYCEEHRRICWAVPPRFRALEAAA